MAPAPASASDPTKSSDVVLVCCKLPLGLKLELVEPGELRKPRPPGKFIIVKGANSLREDKTKSQGEFPYATTPVDRSFWNEWLKRNGELEFVKKGFIFAAENEKEARQRAKELAPQRTGLEALATDKDPRVAQRLGANVETDPEALARAQAAPT